jgi:hypothetical protein
MAQTAQGVQLPPDSTGKITAGFSISVHNDVTGVEDTVVIPATVIVDSNGEDIGTKILRALTELVAEIHKMNELNMLMEEALNR